MTTIINIVEYQMEKTMQHETYTLNQEDYLGFRMQNGKP